MKPIVISEKEKKNLMDKFSAEFAKTLNDYTFQGKNEITFKAQVGSKIKNKIMIRYSPLAYLRMKKLVDFFSSEVGWYGLIEKRSDNEYYIYDVLVPRQQVDGAKVDTDDDDMLEFFGNLTDEQADNMFFQAHSHVNMDTLPSGTDCQNQMDILSNIPGHHGFYLFQIWNKRGDINSFLYDLDANTFYDRNDVELVVDDPEYGSLVGFVAQVEKLVEQRCKTPYKKPEKKEPTNIRNYSSRYLNGVPDYDDFETDGDEGDVLESGEYPLYNNYYYGNYYGGYYYNNPYNVNRS